MKVARFKPERVRNAAYRLSLGFALTGIDLAVVKVIIADTLREYAGKKTKGAQA